MTYKVQVEGEYMELWTSGAREASDIERARNYAAKFRLNPTTEPHDVSIHAFDRFGNFAHVVS